MRTLAISILITVLSLAPDRAAAQICGHWEPLPITDLQPGVNGQVKDMARFDDGSGTATFIAGNFQWPVQPNRAWLLKWAGGTLTRYPLDEPASALKVIDFGSGPELYIGTLSSIYRLQHGQLTRLPGVFNDFVTCLAGEIDNGIPTLYASGYFSQIDGTPVNLVARFDGTSWHNLGSDLTQSQGISSIALFDGGDGSALYVGGYFTQIAGVQAKGIARWRAGAWSALPGSQLVEEPPYGSLFVHSILPGPDGLYIAGRFGGAGAVVSNGIIRWTGSQWQGIGTGLPPVTSVTCLAWHNDGTGTALYAGGRSLSVSGPLAHGLAKWTGTSWTPVGTGLSQGLLNGLWPDSLVSSTDPAGPALYIGGEFTSAGGLNTSNLALWRPSGFERAPLSRLPTISTMNVLDIGAGPQLYLAGDFVTLGGVVVNNLARWTGSAWAPCGDGLNGPVTSLAAANLGQGPALYAAGVFDRAGSVPASNIASWNGVTWSPLGNGITFASADSFMPRVAGITEFGAPGDRYLYAAGAFGAAGAVPETKHLARWNGLTWTSIGHVTEELSSLGTFGGRLCAGALYESSIGQSPNFVVGDWNGTAWAPVGDFGMWGPLRMFTHDVGNGPRLYAAGGFPWAGSGTVQWDGQSWESLGGPAGRCTFSADPTLHDRGLYALGPLPDGSSLGRWDGTSWTPITDYVLGGPGWWSACAYFDDGSGPALYAQMDFTSVGGQDTTLLARFKFCPPCCPNCDSSTSPPLLTANDFQCFLNKFAAADPYANCDHSTNPPTLNANDFQCFLNAFAGGCP